MFIATAPRGKTCGFKQLLPFAVALVPLTAIRPGVPELDSALSDDQRALSARLLSRGSQVRPLPGAPIFSESVGKSRHEASSESVNDGQLPSPFSEALSVAPAKSVAPSTTALRRTAHRPTYDIGVSELETLSSGQLASFRDCPTKPFSRETRHLQGRLASV